MSLLRTYTKNSTYGKKYKTFNGNKKPRKFNKYQKFNKIQKIQLPKILNIKLFRSYFKNYPAYYFTKEFRFYRKQYKYFTEFLKYSTKKIKFVKKISFLKIVTTYLFYLKYSATIYMTRIGKKLKNMPYWLLFCYRIYKKRWSIQNLLSSLKFSKGKNRIIFSNFFKKVLTIKQIRKFSGRKIKKLVTFSLVKKKKLFPIYTFGKLRYFLKAKIFPINIIRRFELHSFNYTARKFKKEQDLRILYQKYGKNNKHPTLKIYPIKADLQYKISLFTQKNSHILNPIIWKYNNLFLTGIAPVSIEFFYQKILHFQIRIRKMLQRFYNLTTLRRFFTVFRTASEYRFSSSLQINPEEKLITGLDLQLSHILLKLNILALSKLFNYQIKSGHIFVNQLVVTNPYYILKLGDSFHVSLFYYFFNILWGKVRVINKNSEKFLNYSSFTKSLPVKFFKKKIKNQFIYKTNIYTTFFNKIKNRNKFIIQKNYVLLNQSMLAKNIYLKQNHFIKYSPFHRYYKSFYKKKPFIDFPIFIKKLKIKTKKSKVYFHNNFFSINKTLPKIQKISLKNKVFISTFNFYKINKFLKNININYNLYIYFYIIFKYLNSAVLKKQKKKIKKKLIKKFTFKVFKKLIKIFLLKKNKKKLYKNTQLYFKTICGKKKINFELKKIKLIFNFILKINFFEELKLSQFISIIKHISSIKNIKNIKLLKLYQNFCIFLLINTKILPYKKFLQLFFFFRLLHKNNFKQISTFFPKQTLLRKIDNNNTKNIFSNSKNYLKQILGKNFWLSSTSFIYRKVMLLLQVKQKTLIPNFFEFSPRIFYGIIYRKPNFFDFYFQPNYIYSNFKRMHLLKQYLFLFFGKLKINNITLLKQTALQIKKNLIFNNIFSKFFSEFQYKLPWF